MVTAGPMNVKVATVICAVFLVYGCGGGGNTSGQLTRSTARDQTQSKLAVAKNLQLSVVTLEKVAERRVSRTEWDYDLRPIIKNDGTDVERATLILASSGDGTTIIQDFTSVDKIQGATTKASNGTITIRQDRTIKFSAEDLVWSFVQSADSTLGPAGGTAALSGVASATFPINFFQFPATVTIQEIDDAGFDAEFASGTDLFDIAGSSNTNIVVSSDFSGSSPSGSFRLTLALPEDLVAAVNSGGQPTIFAWDLDATEGEETQESFGAYEALDSTYDSANGTVTAEIPSRLFRRLSPQAHAPQPNLQSTIRLAVLGNSLASSLSQSSGGARIAATAAPPFCGAATWKSPLTDYRVVAAFGEPRAMGPHQGMDLVTRNAAGAVVSKPVVAVDNGYVARVSLQSCSLKKKRGRPDKIVCIKKKDKAWKSVWNLNGPVYSLVLNTANGAVAYRHLALGSVVIPELKTNPNILTYWTDTTRKYSVRAGTLLAMSGATGAKAGHLHIEYKPFSENSPRNPLCHLVSLDATPNPVRLPLQVWTHGQDHFYTGQASTPGNRSFTAIVSTGLFDQDHNEYLIRRQQLSKFRKEKFLSATALPYPNNRGALGFEPDSQGTMSNLVMGTLVYGYVDPGLPYLFADGVLTDNGQLEVVGNGDGTDTLTIGASIPWVVKGASPTNTPINTVKLPVVSRITTEDAALSCSISKDVYGRVITSLSAFGSIAGPETLVASLPPANYSRGGELSVPFVVDTYFGTGLSNGGLTLRCGVWTPGPQGICYRPEGAPAVTNWSGTGTIYSDLSGRQVGIYVIRYPVALSTGVLSLVKASCN